MKRFDIREIQAVQQVIESGKLSRFFRNFRGGPHIQAFEEEFAEYIGAKHAIAVSNGTVALEIALKGLKIGVGDEIVTTPLSFVATGTAILSVGATPVFVDINPSTLNIELSQIKKAVSDNTKAIIPVSLLGYPCEMSRITKFAENNDLFVIEDGAQALGASIDDKKIGTFGNAASFSFQETKVITTLGEGGIIVTDEPALADRCRHIRNHGNIYGWLAITDCVCTNSRMTEAQAAFGRIQLQKLDLFNKIQIENAEYFLRKIPKKYLSPIYSVPDKNYEPIYLLIPLLLTDDSPLSRDEIIEHLILKGVSKGIPGQNVGYYKSLIYDHPIFASHSPKSNPLLPQCPMAEWIKDRVLLFDIHRWRDKSLIDKCIAVLEEIFA